MMQKDVCRCGIAGAPDRVDTIFGRLSSYFNVIFRGNWGVLGMNMRDTVIFRRTALFF